MQSAPVQVYFIQVSFHGTVLTWTSRTLLTAEKIVELLEGVQTVAGMLIKDFKLSKKV